MRSRRPGGEPLDLVEQHVGRVAVVALRHVRVGQTGCRSPDERSGVGEVLLADEDEGPLGHPAPVDVPLGRHQLLE